MHSRKSTGREMAPGLETGEMTQSDGDECTGWEQSYETGMSKWRGH